MSNTSAKEKERLQFDFTSEALQRLEEMQGKSGAATRAEVVRSALRLYEWLLNDVDPEDTIQVVTKKGQTVSAFKAKLLLR